MAAADGEWSGSDGWKSPDVRASGDRAAAALGFTRNLLSPALAGLEAHARAVLATLLSVRMPLGPASRAPSKLPA